jgi:hypothetical protein
MSRFSGWLLVVLLLLPVVAAAADLSEDKTFFMGGEARVATVRSVGNPPLYFIGAGNHFACQAFPWALNGQEQVSYQCFGSDNVSTGSTGGMVWTQREGEVATVTPNDSVLAWWHRSLMKHSLAR